MKVDRSTLHWCLADLTGFIVTFVSSLSPAIIGKLHLFSHLLGNKNISQGI